MTPQERPHDKSISPMTSNSVLTSRTCKQWVGGNAIDKEEQRTNICQKEHVLPSLLLHPTPVPSHKPMSVKGGTVCPVSSTSSQKPSPTPPSPQSPYTATAQIQETPPLEYFSNLSLLSRSFYSLAPTYRFPALPPTPCPCPTDSLHLGFFMNSSSVPSHSFPQGPLSPASLS